MLIQWPLLDFLCLRVSVSQVVFLIDPSTLPSAAINNIFPLLPLSSHLPPFSCQADARVASQHPPVPRPRSPAIPLCSRLTGWHTISKVSWANWFVHNLDGPLGRTTAKLKTSPSPTLLSDKSSDSGPAKKKKKKVITSSAICGSHMSLSEITGCLIFWSFFF